MMQSNFPWSDYLSPKYWPTWIGIVFLRIMSVLPLPIGALLGYVIGLMAYMGVAKRRKIAYQNIKLCFPELSDKQCKRINRWHFCYSGQAIFTTPMCMWVSLERFTKMVEVKNEHYLQQALDNNKNIIVLAPHFIGMDIGGMFISTKKPGFGMYQYTKNALIGEFIKRGRSRFGSILVERKSGLRGIIKHLKQGSPFYYLPDQDAGRKGVFVPFFHTLASTTPTLGKFAQVADAVVITCQVHIKPWGRGFEVRFGSPLQDFPTADEMQDTTVMNQAIEKMIRLDPEQYFWMHKRYKTRPDGGNASDIYPFL